MFNLLCMMVIFLSVLCVMTNNILVWWSVFLLMTSFFVQLNKGLMSYSSLFNYFVFQESLGLIFLLFNFQFLQLMILFMKVGIAPLHFWLFSVTNGVYGLNLMWFLTFQKFPFVMVMVQMLLMQIIILLIFGIAVCLLQMLMMKSVKNLLILSSTESFNWIMMSFVLSFLNVGIVFVYYLMLMLIMVPKLEILVNVNKVSWETMLIFMNLPFTVNFFVKIFSLISMLKFYSVWILLLLFVMFMSVLSLSYWMVNLSVKNVVLSKYNKWNFMIFMPLMLMMFV
uniref:NADH dehydrogenase subunit 2 n=1 Tax=Trichostrongylus vitrinus TaxID=40352 RepID=D3J800_TRIVI|nr:NADH dehydrogenase subunit 2 [Trichostrongylus vitrinus]ACX85101.1 NADH dehydrogenase subunit 2 [Trichostrongylus vitrinus]